MSQGVNFVSGPRIAIKFGHKTIAYAVGLNLSFSVNITPVMTLGRYDSSALEPTAFSLVRGSMTVVKLRGSIGDTNLLPDTSLTDKQTDYLSDHLNPSTVLTSSTFDITVQLAVTTKNAAGNIVTAGSIEMVKVIDCRLSSMNGAITVGQLLNETVSFEGLMMIDANTEADYKTPDKPIPNSK